MSRGWITVAAALVLTMGLALAASGCMFEADPIPRGAIKDPALPDHNPTADPADPSDPAEPSEPSDPPADPCMGIDYLGECAGDVARWCEDGRIVERDCGALGQTCGYIDDTLGFYCDESAPDPDPDPDPEPDPEPEPEPTGACGTATEQEELRLTNEARASVGLPALVCDPLMTEVARAHSQDMCDRRYFSHTNLDGQSPFDRMRAAGVSYSRAGENIAAGQSSPAAAHTSWMNSSGHRANILGSGYGRIGIGHVECPGGSYGHYWTQVFAN